MEFSVHLRCDDFRVVLFCADRLGVLGGRADVEDGVVAGAPSDRRQPVRPLGQRPDVRQNFQILAHVDKRLGVGVNFGPPLFGVGVRGCVEDDAGFTAFFTRDQHA